MATRFAPGWYAVGILWLAYVCSFVDRQVLALLVEPVKATLAISDTQFSLLQGLAFGIFYSAMGLPCGWLVDRYSRRLVIALGIALWSAATAACGLAAGFWPLFAARMLIGVGEATLSPGALSLLSDHFPRERRALPLSVYISAGSFGSGLAMLAGAAAIAYATAHPIHLALAGVIEGWRAVFLLVGSPGLAIALALFTVREPPRTANGPGSGAAPRMAGGFAAAWAFIAVRRSLFLGHYGGLALLSWLSYALLAWTPAYFIRIHGWSLAETGWRFGLTYLGFGFGGAVLGGISANRLRARYLDGNLRNVAIGMTAIIAPLIAAPLVTNPWLSLLLFGIAIFFTAFPSGASATVISEVTPSRLRGQVSAIYYLTMSIVGLTAGPLSVALITDRVLHDPQRVGLSLAIVFAFAAPLGALLVWSALPALRSCLVQDLRQP
jgi:MFS family permease